MPVYPAVAEVLFEQVRQPPTVDEILCRPRTRTAVDSVFADASYEHIRKTLATVVRRAHECPVLFLSVRATTHIDLLADPQEKTQWS